MEPKEVHKLREAVIESLQDGRDMQSLKTALRDSGYSNEDIHEVTSGIDPKRVTRKPPKRKMPWGTVASAVVVVFIILGIYMVFFQAGPEAPTGKIVPTPNETDEPGPSGQEIPEDSVKICYASNETIRDTMIEAGAQCDRWFIIKEVS